MPCRSRWLRGYPKVQLIIEGGMFMLMELPADVIGLTKAAPVSRRGFMSASAATVAGYTLAAGPVRAQVVTTTPRASTQAMRR